MPPLHSTAPDLASIGNNRLKQPRIPENPANVDTVAVVGAVDAGFDDRAIEAFFAQLPGFVAFKQNPTMGGGFAKFASTTLAAQAVALAKEEAIPADMAKSSMGTVPAQFPPGYPPPVCPPQRNIPEVGQPIKVTHNPS